MNSIIPEKLISYMKNVHDSIEIESYENKKIFVSQEAHKGISNQYIEEPSSA